MIRKLYIQIGWGKFLLLLVFSAAFGLSERTSGTSELSAHVLAALNDQHYFIFAVLPILLFICGSVMEERGKVRGNQPEHAQQDQRGVEPDDKAVVAFYFFKDGTAQFP